MKRYNKEQKKVCEYLQLIAPDIGCGDDPVGFLLASHAELGRRMKIYRAALTSAHIPAETNKGYPTIQSEAVKAFCDAALSGVYV